MVRGPVTKSNGNRSLESLSDRAYEIAKRRQAAADSVVTMLEQQYEAIFQSHAATVLRAAAWLAGTSLYRSLDNEAKGSPLPETASDQEGLKLLKVFMLLVDKNGIQLKPEEYASSIPPEEEPRVNMMQVQQQFEGRYHEIMQQHGFDLLEGARTGAVACARMVKLHCLNRKDVQPNIAASTVSIGFVEGSKMVPGDGGTANGE